MSAAPLELGGFRRPPDRAGIAFASMLVAIAAVVAPAWLVARWPAAKYRVAATVPARIVPQDEVPPVEPVRFADLSPDEARDYNAAVPFSTAPNPAARPYRFIGGDDDRTRARDCLAAGALYEAGDNTTGERAVAQVVLNRLRHPAFPKTICAVVFQGSERSTSCQFTFSCDGALDRWHPGDAAWMRARAVADAALTGHVFRPVGYATHYHTDWVVPYWQASLDKVAAVGTHLFFRWSGWWGTPPAFRFNPHDTEPMVPALAALSEAHRPAPSPVPTPTPAPTMISDPALPDISTGAASAGPVLLTAFAKTATPDQYPAIATAACVGHPYCKYLAWADRSQVPAVAFSGDQPPVGLAFSYLRDPRTGYDKPLWNCRLTPRADPAQCMRGTAASDSHVPGDHDALPGVRRRGSAPVPVLSPTAPSPR